MTRAEAAEVVAMLVAAYPRQTMTPANAEMYERMLVDLGRAEVVTACEQLVATLRYFPSIAEIREFVARMRTADSGSGASEAWAHLLAEVHRVGYMGSPDLGDAAHAALATLGGWQAFCESTEPPGVLRAHFMRAYDEAVSSSVRRETLRGLPSSQERPVLEAQRESKALGAEAMVARLMSGRK